MKENFLRKKIHPKNTASINFKPANSNNNSTLPDSNKIKQIKSDRTIMKINNNLFKNNKEENLLSVKMSLIKREKEKNNFNYNNAQAKINSEINHKNQNIKTNKSKNISQNQNKKKNLDIKTKKIINNNNNEKSTKTNSSIYDPICSELTDCFTPCFNKEINANRNENIEKPKRLNLSSLVTKTKDKKEIQNNNLYDGNSAIIRQIAKKKITVIRNDKSKRLSADRKNHHLNVSS